MNGVLKKIPYPRTLASLAAGFALYLLLGFFLAPWWIERFVPEFAAEKLQRKASVGGVRLNPLLLKLEVRDFALAESSGAPIVQFQRLLVDFEVSSVARWAWTFSEIALEGLELRADVAPDGRFNLAALLDSFPKEERRPGGKAPRLLLQRVALTAGRIAFSDRSDRTPASAQITPVNLELYDLSTLPDHRGAYTVSARLMDGGVFTWRGDASLDPLSSQGEVSVKGARPLSAWRFLRDELNLAEPRGELDFSARYRFAYANGAGQAALDDIRLAVRGLALTVSGAKEPLLELASIAVAGGRFDLTTRELALKTIEVNEGAVAVEIDAGGVPNWQRLVRTAKGAVPDPRPGPEGAPWKVRAEAVRIAGVALRYSDLSRVTPISVSAGSVDAGLAVEWQAGGGGAQALVTGLALKVARVAMGAAGSAAPVATLDSVELEDGSFDLGMRRIAIRRVGIDGGAVGIVRDKDGRLRALDLLDPADRGRLRREVAASLAGARKEARPWRFTLDALELSRMRVALADRGYEPAISYDLENVRAAVRSITNDGKTPVRFDAALRVAQGGAVRAAGSVGDGGSRVAVSVKVERVSLKPLQPLVARHSTLRLETGVASADAKVEYRAGRERPALRVTGSAGIADFLLNEADGDRLLAGKSLAASGVAFSLAPDRLHVAEVRLVEPGAKIEIARDRSLNLANVLGPKPASAATPDAAKPPADRPAAPAGSAPPFEVGVERVVVENGIVDFADLSLVLPFAAKVEELRGAATGITSDAAGAAALKLEGRVGEFGLARVDGSFKPFQPKSFTDIGVVFRNIEMLPLSPYSATFAGRHIASGRLSLDLRYKIENGQLAGDNKVELERFTLGERVESPGALSLPLDLAIALLTDSDGKINVTVPVTGNVDDPQFSYGHLIWQAIATVIRNIVTAPFRALAGLFGGGGEKLESIDFDAGRATLQPPEREKLKRVAEAVAKRPQLVLVAEGQYGEADRAALRQREVALAIAARLGRPPAAGGQAEPVNPLDAKTQRAMEALFVERSSETALAQFVADAEKARGKPVARVNAVLALAGRASADAAFYQAMLKHLNDTARIAEGAPGRLADARARAVTGYLQEALSVPAERVAAKVAAEPGSERVRLTFDVARGAQP